MRKSKLGFWALMLLLGVALLASCNQQSNNPPQDEKGTLIVTVTPSNATVSVIKDSSVVFSQAGGFTKEFAPGDYTVRAELQGYNASEQQVTIVANQSKTVNIQLTQSAPQPVASVEITRYYDQWGYPFAVKKEINQGKVVDLLAAQFEDSLCVDIVAKDADGAPVPNALVSVANFGRYEAFAVPGCVKDGTEPSTQAVPEIRTDSNGKATFTLFLAPGAGGGVDWYNFRDEPSKFVVSATSAGHTGINEFKVFFFNIDHLYYNDHPVVHNRVAGQARGGGNHQVDFGKRSAQRWGYDFGTFTNTFRHSEHVFDTVIPTGQPQYDEDIDPLAIGHIIYSLEGSDASKVKFGMCEHQSSPTICVDDDGLISIDLANGVTQEDLPIEVTVKATLQVIVHYGDKAYSFNLKQYSFKKRWVGAFLKITKKIDHHVVTWKGPKHTLGQTGNLASPWIATYTITVSNPSQQTATNATITDALPPELGYVTGSATPAATYDNTLHELTWVVGDLAPGDSVNVSFSVFARQKPGFCWDAGAYYYSARAPKTGSIAGQDGTCQNPYNDPYSVINGQYTDDVTVEADDIDPIDYDPVPEDVILYVVRPLFAVKKQFVGPGGVPSDTIAPVLEDDNVEYVFKVSNLSRDSEAGYHSLISTYPNEFDGTDYANPYGSGVKLVDYFDTGLDYDSSEGGTWSASNEKFVDFGKEDLLPYKGTAFTDRKLALTAAEPTTENNPWYNCAYVSADNLNQPGEGNFVGIDWPQNIQKQLGPSAWDTLSHPPHEARPSHISGTLESCVSVSVNETVGNKYVTISNAKEHLSSDPTSGGADPSHVGDDFWYFFLVNADDHNPSSINGITFRVTLSGNHTLPVGNPPEIRVMEAAGNNNSDWHSLTWQDVPGMTASLSGSAITFSQYHNLQAGHYLLYMVHVSATSQGTATATGEITQIDAGVNTTDPVSEQTYIKP